MTNLAESLATIDQLETGPKRKRLALVASKGTLDAASPPLILATTAASLGWEVGIYFTFYGLDILLAGTAWPGKSIGKQLGSLMRDTDSAAVQRHLIEGRADIGIASLPPLPGFQRDLLFSDPYGVVCPVGHALMQDWQQLTWADLHGVRFIANGLCSQITDTGFQPILAACNLMVRNTASLLTMVRAGAGVTILPQLAVLPEFPDLAFLPLANTEARREVWLMTLPDSSASPAVNALAQAIRDEDLDLAP